MDARILQRTADAVRSIEVDEAFAPVHLKLGVPPGRITEHSIPADTHTGTVDSGRGNGKQDPAAAGGFGSGMPTLPEIEEPSSRLRAQLRSDTRVRRDSRELMTALSREAELQDFRESGYNDRRVPAPGCVPNSGPIPRRDSRELMTALSRTSWFSR